MAVEMGRRRSQVALVGIQICLGSLVSVISAAVQIEIMKTFFYDAADKIAKSGKDALNTFGEGDELRMMLMGLRRFTKVDSLNVKESRQVIAQKLIADNAYTL